MSEQQRIIKLFIKEKTKIQKNMNSCGIVYSVYSPKKIVIKPTNIIQIVFKLFDSIQIETGITVTLADEIHATVAI